MLQLCTYTAEIIVLNNLHSSILITYSRLHVFLCVVLLLVVQMQINVCVTCIQLVVQGVVNIEYVCRDETAIPT